MSLGKMTLPLPGLHSLDFCLSTQYGSCLPASLYPYHLHPHPHHHPPDPELQEPLPKWTPYLQFLSLPNNKAVLCIASKAPFFGGYKTDQLSLHGLPISLSIKTKHKEAHGCPVR